MLQNSYIDSFFIEDEELKAIEVIINEVGDSYVLTREEWEMGRCAERWRDGYSEAVDIREQIVG